MAAAAGLTGCFSAGVTGMSSALRENGVPAEARILAVWDTGQAVDNDPVIGMRVEVRPADRPAFNATIPKTLVSRIAAAQFQPGKEVSVRYDRQNPAVVAVDLAGPSASPETGNPFHAHFVRAFAGSAFLPPERSPDVYRGTANSVADDLALVENGYALLGASAVDRGEGDLPQAIDEGIRIGAAVVLLYGQFDVAAGPPLGMLPFNASAVEPSASAVRTALYYGRYRLPILGIAVRCLSDDLKAQTPRGNGVLIVGVTNGSPAAAADFQRGDILLAIDEKPVDDAFAVPALLKSLAGRSVTIDLLREGSPVSVKVRLNPAISR